MELRSPSPRSRRRLGAVAFVLAALLLAGGALFAGAIALDSLASTTAGPAASAGAPRLWASGGVSAEDGVVTEGASLSVFDVDSPAIGNLDPALRDALQRAATVAATEGVVFEVTSGWRSAELQEQLQRDALETYGSAEEAARWVAAPGTSPHETGHAVDLGNVDATAWLSLRGAEFGLCQIYENEAWHFELRPEAETQGCPPMYADPTHDPRIG